MEILLKPPSALPGRTIPGKGLVHPRPCHGLNGPDSCLYCDHPIDDSNAKVVTFKSRAERICNDCFNEPEYQAIVLKYNPKVKDYSL